MVTVKGAEKEVTDKKIYLIPTCDRATRPIVSLLKTRNTVLFLYFCTKEFSALV